MVEGTEKCVTVSSFIFKFLIVGGPEILRHTFDERERNTTAIDSHKFSLIKGISTVHTNEMPPKKKTKRISRLKNEANYLKDSFSVSLQKFIHFSLWLFSFRMYVKIFASFCFVVALLLTLTLNEEVFNKTCLGFHPQKFWVSYETNKKSKKKGQLN